MDLRAGRVYMPPGVVSLLWTCLVLVTGIVAPAAAGLFIDVDEADLVEDVDECGRARQCPHKTSSGREVSGTTNSIVNSTAQDSSAVPADGSGGRLGMGHQTREGSSIVETRRSRDGEPTCRESLPPSSGPPIPDATAIRFPLAGVVIPGHPAFTELSTGPPQRITPSWPGTAALHSAAQPQLLAGITDPRAFVVVPARSAVPRVILDLSQPLRSRSRISATSRWFTETTRATVGVAHTQRVG